MQMKIVGGYTTSKQHEQWRSVRPWVQVIVGGYTTSKQYEVWSSVGAPPAGGDGHAVAVRRGLALRQGYPHSPPRFSST